EPDERLLARQRFEPRRLAHALGQRRREYQSRLLGPCRPSAGHQRSRSGCLQDRSSRDHGLLPARPRMVATRCRRTTSARIGHHFIKKNTARTSLLNVGHDAYWTSATMTVTPPVAKLARSATVRCPSGVAMTFFMWS